MKPEDFKSQAAGRVILHPTGYHAFIPAPLPPPLTFDQDLVLNLSRADAARSRPPRGAVRAQGFRPVGDLEHQPLRSMGRRTRKRALQSACATRPGCRSRTDRTRWVHRWSYFDTADADELNYSSSPNLLATSAAMASIASRACGPVAETVIDEPMPAPSVNIPMID